ncbi:MAG: NIPSNAP family protein, partial [Sphingomicrobium sp.]
MSRILELRVYTLRPGTRDAFHRRFTEEIGPMLEGFGVEVVGALPSLHDERSFTLIRAFPSLAEREAQLARFY